MNPTAYTNLESLFLLQLLQKYGFTNGIFNRLSAELKVNSLLREQDGYDAGRLSPESLQEHLFQLIRDDPALLAQQDAHESNGHPPGLSPTSKKRKLSSPAQPTLQAFAQSDRLPGLVDKLYKRYRDDVVRAIKEDESRIELLVREIRDLETAEKAEKIAAQQERKAATVNGNAAAAAADDAKNVKPPPKPNGQAAQTPVPVPTPSQQPNLNVKTATPGPAPPPQNQAPPRASVLLSSQQPVKTATQPQSQPQGIVKGQSQGQPQSQPPGQPQGQPQVQPPAQPQNQPPAQPQAQPPAQPQAQPPAQSQAQPLAQSQAQPPAQSQGPDRRGAHPSPSPVPQNVRPPSVRPNNVGTPPNGTPSGLQHPQAAQAYGPPPTSASPQPHFAEAPRSQTPGIGAGARASPQPQSGSQLKWEPPYRPQQSPVPPAGGVPSRPAYTQQPARPPPSYPNQPQSGGHAQHPQHQLPHAAQPHAHTQYPQNFAPNRQTPQPPASSARTPTPVASQPSHPVLLPPQNAGQMPPSLSSLPANATPDGSGHQPPHPRTSVAPTTSGPATASPAPHYNPPQTHQHPSQQPARPPPLASPQVSTPVRAPNGPFPGGQRPPVPIQQPPHYHQGQGTPSAPSTPLAQHQDGPSRHFGTSQQSPAKQVTAPDQTKRPVSGHAKPPATAPPAVQSRPPSQMSFQTPVKTPSALNISTHVIRGHGTRWISTPTAATPRMEMTGYFDLQSPAVEPVSPPNVPAQLPKTASSQSSAKKEARKAIQRIDTSVTRPRSRLSQSAQIAPSSEEHSEAGADSDAGGQKIKDEEATPKAFDDNVMGAEDHGALPMSALSRGNKRKRLESPEDRMPAAPPTHVLWTRSFNKVSAQALEQIISHRHANMFAGPVKARDAPGYNDIVMQPLDLKKVRAAINHGQRMAQAVEKTLSDIDPNAMNVWLPISVDLVPPKGIINIAQLERELVHMFVNAIMYAPDAERGFGQTFLRQPSDRKQGGDGASEDGDDDDNDAIIGYEVDENGLVKETRNMFLEVEKLLGDLRSEVERNAQPKGMGRLPSMSRSVSAVGGEANTGEEEDDEAAGEGDSFNTAKRRRTRG